MTEVIRYGDCRGVSPGPLLLVTTRPVAPRNVLVRHADGTAAVVPVRSLRVSRPW